MFKSKLKNNLLTEYVEICKVQIFHKGKTENLIEKRANALKKKYEQIFLKIGCVDLSFFILKKELSERKNQGFEFGKIDENAIKKLENYEKTLSEKMKKLRLNEFEIGFIENFA